MRAIGLTIARSVARGGGGGNRRRVASSFRLCVGDFRRDSDVFTRRSLASMWRRSRVPPYATTFCSHHDARSRQNAVCKLEYLTPQVAAVFITKLQKFFLFVFADSFECCSDAACVRGKLCERSSARHLVTRDTSARSTGDRQFRIAKNKLLNKILAADRRTKS